MGFGIMAVVLLDAVPNLEALPVWFPGRLVVGVLTGALLIPAGAGLVANRQSSRAAVLIGSVLLFWLIVLQAPRLIANPLNGGIWVVAFEVVAIGAAAWMLAASLSSDGSRADVWRRVAVGARLAYGLSFLAFGISHFVYHGYVESVIPAWIPAHRFWAYATGMAHLAAGVSLLTRIQARLAATLLAIMFGSWVLVVHIPRVAKTGGGNEWTSFLVAIAMCGGAWLVSACLGGGREQAPQTTKLGAAGSAGFRLHVEESADRRPVG
jgi:uncharacterized membrane protein YphA (DoxX/SURF4 family)